MEGWNWSSHSIILEVFAVLFDSVGHTQDSVYVIGVLNNYNYLLCMFQGLAIMMSRLL